MNKTRRKAMTNKNYLTDLFGLDGKVAVVIGGSGVLGGVMAEGLAGAGAKVAVLGRTMEKAEKNANRIHDQYNCETVAIQVNASDKSALEAAKKQILDLWGRVDILVN